MVKDDTISGCYSIDKRRLTELLTATKSRIGGSNRRYTETFDIDLVGAGHVETDSVQTLIAIEQEIESLSITCLSMSSTDDDEQEVKIDCLSSADPKLHLRVRGGDEKHVGDTVTLVRQQLQPMLVTKFGPRIAASRLLRDVVSLGIVMLIVAAVVAGFLFGSGLVPWRKSRTMWLSSSDLVYFKEKTKEGQRLTNEDVLELVTRQIRAMEGGGPTSGMPVSTHQLVWIALVIVTFSAGIFAVVSCYPPVVFLWGEGEKKLGRARRRRTWCWSTVFGGIILGVLTNYS